MFVLKFFTKGESRYRGAIRVGRFVNNDSSSLNAISLHVGIVLMGKELVLNFKAFVKSSHHHKCKRVHAYVHKIMIF